MLSQPYNFYLYEHYRFGSTVKYALSSWELIQSVKPLLFFIASRPTLGSDQPAMQWVTLGSFSGVKRSGSEADHLPPFSADIKNSCNYTTTWPHVFTAWCIFKHRDNFTLIIAYGQASQKGVYSNVLKWSRIWSLLKILWRNVFAFNLKYCKFSFVSFTCQLSIRSVF
jgi:hypothetical protein